MKIAVFFVGELHDAGFNESALAGVEASACATGTPLEVISGTPYDQTEIWNRLTDVARDMDGVIFVGGQGDLAMPKLAEAYPEKRFAIVQGTRTGPNLASYSVMQELSAFQAGCLAALETRTGKVAHLSGHRVAPGLKGRAAFVGGVRHINPAIDVLTAFCGTQDDNMVTNRWADAMLQEGADIVFTMLNGARKGVIDACRERDARQIGNALDWCLKDADLFVGSAVARIDLGMIVAINDMRANKVPDSVVEFGVSSAGSEAYAYLTLGSNVSPGTRTRLQAINTLLIGQGISVPHAYEGPEFELEAARCL